MVYSSEKSDTSKNMGGYGGEGGERGREREKEEVSHTLSPSILLYSLTFLMYKFIE